MLGGSEGSASRSEIKPWASPITDMSTTTLVPEDWRRKQERKEVGENRLFVRYLWCNAVMKRAASLSLYTVKMRISRL